MSSVTFQNVSKVFDDLMVIKDFTLFIENGHFISFLGPSGCGKTTILRMLAGLEKNTLGIIKLGEVIVSSPEEKIFIFPEKRKIGMVFQSYAVWPHMNVFENVAYPLKIQKVEKKERFAQVQEILKLVKLDGLEDRMPSQLSGGQQQRVALARGLVMRPKVLLLDEPLSNLDAKLREKMREDIRRIQQQFKMTCLYVTHDQSEAFEMSDRIVILDRGVIVQVGEPMEIRNTPVNSFVEEFIR
jgi:iron(III) transport system ATP-binding protein